MNRNEALEQFIGYQLVDLTEGYLIVKKDDKTLVFEIDEDYGDCCGYNELHAQMFEDCKRNPVIVNMEIDGDSMGEGDSLIITFFGEHNSPIGELTSFSSSGSGWGYGANTRLRCKETDDEIILTEW